MESAAGATMILKPKNELDLDGFSGEIGRRQKSFDLRQKIV